MSLTSKHRVDWHEAASCAFKSNSKTIHIFSNTYPNIRSVKTAIGLTYLLLKS